MELIINVKKTFSMQKLLDSLVPLDADARGFILYWSTGV